MKIIYTNWLPKGVGAMYLGFAILVRPKYKGDEGLIAHELTHHQQRLHTRNWFVKYLFDAEFRQAQEVEAYKVQLKYSPNCLDKFAGYLANDYGLKLTHEEAKRLLCS